MIITTIGSTTTTTALSLLLSIFIANRIQLFVNNILYLITIPVLLFCYFCITFSDINK